MSLKEKWQKLRGILGLSLAMAKANFKLRTEGSYLGVVWYLLEPLLLFVILLYIQKVTNQSIPNYGLYLIVGLIMFNFFSNSTLNAINSIRGNSKFIKSVKLNSLSLVGSSMLQAIFSHFFEFIILIIFFIIYKAPIINLAYYPIIFILLVIFCLGISLILATLGAHITDLANVWRVITRMLWFATPIFYALNEKLSFHKISLLNPMYQFIKMARDLMIYNLNINYGSWMILLIISLAFLIIGLWVFNKYKNKFAEIT